MSTEQDNQLLSGSIFKSLTTFTIPILFALLLQVMYSTVDMLVVSNFASTADVSAVANGSQLMNLLVSACTGIATGATILLAQYFGKNDIKNINKVVGNSITLFIFLSSLITIIFVLLNQLFVYLLNVPSEAITSTSQYLFYASLGIPMIFLYNIIGSIFRGIGDSKTALVTVAIACIINIILDLIFVIAFSMGAKGAAIATTIAQATSVILSYIIFTKNRNFSLTHRDFVPDFSMLKKILFLGIPLALQSLLVSLSFLLITIIINKFGIVYSAAVGVVEKLTGLIMLVPMAFMQSISIFTSQNRSVGNHDRTKRGLTISISTSLVVGITMAYLSFFHSELLLSIFKPEPAVVKIGIGYLKSYAFDTIFVCVLFNISGFFNGYEKSFFVMLQAVIGALFIRVPLAFLFSTITPTSLFMIGISTPIATFLQIISCFFYYFYLKNKKNLY